MKTLLLLALVALLATACGDSSSTGSGTNTPSSSGANPLNAPADYLGAITKGQQAAEKTVDTAALNKAIQLFNLEQGRNPKDLNELVQEKFIPQLPTPPPGTKMIYDAGSGTVRVVKQ